MRFQTAVNGGQNEKTKHERICSGAGDDGRTLYDAGAFCTGSDRCAGRQRIGSGI